MESYEMEFIKDAYFPLRPATRYVILKPERENQRHGLPSKQH